MSTFDPAGFDPLGFDTGSLPDEGPVITSSGSVSVVENTSTNTVFYTATANEPVTWSLGGTDASAFTINSNGEIRFNVSPNYETKSSYTVTLIASDGELSAQQTLTVTILNVDETAPVITSSLAPITVAENTTDLTYTATANEAVTWSLAGPDQGVFSIHPTTGVLTIGSAPDYETKSQYLVDIVATDTGGNSTSARLTINVSDSPEGGITSPSTATVAENIPVGQIAYQAISDTENIYWSISGPDADFLWIDSTTGAVRFIQSPNYENKNSYSFVVEATPLVGSTGTKSVTINVTDVTEAQPSPSSTTFTAVLQNVGSAYTVGWEITDAGGNLRTPVTDFLSSAEGLEVTMEESQFDAARAHTNGVVVSAFIELDGAPVLIEGNRIEDRWSVMRVVDGSSGVTAKIIWIRSATKPPRPVGDGTPDGWFDTPIGGDDPLWSSVATQNLDGTAVTAWSDPRREDSPHVRFRWSSNLIDWHEGFTEGDIWFQTSADDGLTWDEPVRAVGESGTGTQHVFKLVAEGAAVPATPSGDNIPTGWSDAPGIGEGDQYMSTSQQNPDGTLKEGTTWSVPVRINGRSGKSAITAMLTNEMHGVIADNAGNVLSYAGAESDGVIFFGDEEASQYFNASVGQNPNRLQVTIDNTQPRPHFTVTGASNTLNTDFGKATVTSADLEIVFTGGGVFSGTVVSKIFTLKKFIQAADGTPGDPGDDAVGIYLISNMQTVPFDAGGTVISDENIVFTPVRMNNTHSITWTLMTVEGQVLSLASLTPAPNSGAQMLPVIFQNICNTYNTKGIIVEASILSGAYQDRISVVKVSDGAGGIYDADLTFSNPPSGSQSNYFLYANEIARCTIEGKKGGGTFKIGYSGSFSPPSGQSAIAYFIIEHRLSTSSSWTAARSGIAQIAQSGAGTLFMEFGHVWAAPTPSGDYDIRLRCYVNSGAGFTFTSEVFTAEWTPIT